MASAPKLTVALEDKTGSSATSDPTLTGTSDTTGTVTLTAGTTQLGTVDVTAGETWTFTPTGLADGSYIVTAAEGTTPKIGTAKVNLALDTKTPAVSSVAVTTPSGSTDLRAGEKVTITLTLTDKVSVTGGRPKLLLNDGGTATFAGISKDGTTLTFTYQVNAGQNAADLSVFGVASNGATVANAAGTTADLSGAVGSLPAPSGASSGPIVVDTVAPTITDVTAATTDNSTNLRAGQVVTITLTTSQAVTVVGGPPALLLNDGGTATYDAAASTSTKLVFKYTVLAGQGTSDLLTTRSGLRLNGATIADAAGNHLSTSGANSVALLESGTSIIVDTSQPLITATTAPHESPNLPIGSWVSVTLHVNEPVFVNGATEPTITLSNGAVATYSYGSGTNQLVFKYQVTDATNGNTVGISLKTLDVPHGTTITDAAGQPLYCFMAGTLVCTPDGERAVESLGIGDLVLTSAGEVKPVVWIGRQTVSRVFADPLRVLPIRIAAGALDANLPARDLLVSADHALLIDGVLIQAGALVNGTTIRREENVPAVFTYYHVELADHALVLAEGVPAETFVDNVDRMAFDNWEEHLALYPQGLAVAELPLPRAKSHRQVPMAIRARLAQRAAELLGVAAEAA